MVEVEVVNTSARDGSGIEEVGLFVVDCAGEEFAANLGVSVLLIEGVGSNWLFDVEIAAKEPHGVSHIVGHRERAVNKQMSLRRL
jgi:hypothetical protein